MVGVLVGWKEARGWRQGSCGGGLGMRVGVGIVAVLQSRDDGGDDGGIACFV